LLTFESRRASDQLNLLFGSLADPTRRGIIDRLAVGEATVSELAAPYPISLPAISRHLKVLERAGIITRSQEGRWRCVRLSPTALTGAAEWIARHEQFSSERVGRLEKHLARRVEGTVGPGDIMATATRGSRGRP
jgi:DNA-binding transcriptional ArsR family regulator